MGQNASVYDLRDPKTKLAHLVNSDHGNVYSLKFETGQTTNLQRPTTLTQDVYFLFFILFLIILFKYFRQIKA